MIEEKDVLYYEVHVTIEPVEGDRLNLFTVLCNDWDFRVADLLMVRNRKATEQRSNKDQFCTGRFNTLEKAKFYMKHLVKLLEIEDFDVWRYKIEAVIFDKRIKYG